MPFFDGAYRRAYAPRLEMPLRVPPDGLAVLLAQRLSAMHSRAMSALRTANNQNNANPPWVGD